MEIILKKRVLVFDFLGGTFFGLQLDEKTSHGNIFHHAFPFDIANATIDEFQGYRHCVRRVTINGKLYRMAMIGMINQGNAKFLLFT